MIKKVIGCLLSVVIACCSNVPAGKAAETAYTATDVLDALLARENEIISARSVTSWEESEDGRVVTWERTTIDKDIAHRIRYENESGGFDSDGKRVSKQHWVRVFDSHSTINLNNRQKFARGDGTVAEATVHNKPNPDPGGPFVFRDPLNLTTIPVIAGIRESANAGRKVVVSNLESDESKLIAMEFQRAAGPKALTWTATIDRDKDWSVTSLIGRSPAGVVRHETKVDFQKIEGGRWVPSVGSWRQFDEDAKPVRGWDFKCELAEINSPNFSDEVFALQVPANSDVLYSPLSIRFRTATSLVGMDAIRARAEAAKRALPSTPKPTPASTANGNHSSRQWLLLANVLVLCILVGWAWRKKSTQ